MDLGLIVQLNHRRGACPSRSTSTHVLTVYDTNGDHQVRVSYCDCSHASTESGNTRVDQLFAQKWFPATWTQPRTVFTFGVLQQFHILNLQSKCNMYDFYRSLLRIRNNAGIENQPVSQFISLVSIRHHASNLKYRTTITSSLAWSAFGVISKCSSAQGGSKIPPE